MPGLPLPTCKTDCCQSRSAGEMCRLQCCVHSNEDEELAAEESFSLYCKPIELYNILQRRAVKNPTFLQRCLLYKIQAMQKKRIHIALSFAAIQNSHLHTQNIFPLYALLARPHPAASLVEQCSIYSIVRAYKLTSFSDFGNEENVEATFIIPGLKKLGTYTRCSNLEIIIISYGDSREYTNGNYLYEDVEPSSFPDIGGHCFWGNIPVDTLDLSLESYAALRLGHRAEMTCKVTMRSGIVKPKTVDQESCLTFCSQQVDTTQSNYYLDASIYAQESGGSELSPYECYSYNDVPAAMLPQIMRLRAGNVLFNYKYYNNTMQKTEVTEDFTCPFCLVQCASYKGVRCHLLSSHDLFSFEFWVNEEYQAVNVYLKNDVWRSEIVADGVDPRLQTFFYRNKSKRRRSGKLKQNTSYVHPHTMESDSPDDAQTVFEDESVPRENGAPRENGLSGASTTNDCAQSVPCSNLSPPPVLQFGKTRKISAERADPRNRLLLQKRQFYHSHRAQPMAIEQVFSDRDSEDEVDDDIADLEDRRMLDDFVDVTKDEKQIMHLWNSFVRKQRVLADGHIPWACEAFCQYHGRDLVQAPKLLWCWRFFMVKLWNHSLLDARSMNNCNTILESFQSESADRKRS